MSYTRYILIMALSAIVLLSIVSVACGISKTQNWGTYTNTKDKYTIEYPGSWSLAKVEPQYADRCIEWQSPNERVFMSVWVDPKENRSLDEFADWYISENRRLNVIFYELVSDVRTTHRGLEARDIKELFSPPSSAMYSCRTLIVSARDSYYSIIVRAPESEYDSYVSVFDHVINSFSLAD
ncbi:MAG: hypothetical protein FJ008_09215 [Chloroflexi bacterium]|nr:hypothetical protein [Chloroflexota bacterium]MBM3155485.1 hypothetical protein [Chloroflexota bacterium]MBM3173777.1 hypothetical protein [Chloroflexota bacterium]MBM3176190.1 hypothetical protein [Chloroflexota bacterium]MBM4450735.1 hypothetical protein [Chloroflexota bacterium]